MKCPHFTFQTYSKADIADVMIFECIHINIESAVLMKRRQQKKKYEIACL